MFSLFAITVYLTTKGLSNWILVTEKVFEYIKLLQVSPPQKWIFDEIQKVCCRYMLHSSYCSFFFVLIPFLAGQYFTYAG
jgi:secreted Zn-dependent insulinase-like peptidase